METWMLVTAVVGAVIIVFLIGQAKKLWNKSHLVREVKQGVQSAQNFKERYPTPKQYEVDVIREFLVQGAEESLLKQVLQDAYDPTLAYSHRVGEEPAHFVDRWLYSIAAPKRWDFIEGMLAYYFQLVQVLLEKKIRPTPLIKNCGGKFAFHQIVELGYASGIPTEELVLKHFESGN